MSGKELEKFTRQFLQKAVQVIVQSRLGGERIKTACNRTGNDWFNISISDIDDVCDLTKKAVETLGTDQQDENGPVSGENSKREKGFSLTTKWRLCCEISLKTTEGETMILEYWFVTNESSDEKAQPDDGHPCSAGAIYDIYNKMSLMLKSLISLTRATPAYRLSSAGQSADSYVICYRVYQSDFLFENILNPKEAVHYTPEIKLGSISCDSNTLTVSMTYRTDMVPCAKSGVDAIANPKLLPLKNDHFHGENNFRNIEAKQHDYDSNKPLDAAFASSPSNTVDTLPFLPEEAFSSLFITATTTKVAAGDSTDGAKPAKSSSIKSNTESKPVSIPEVKNRKLAELVSSPVGSGGSGDSFVFLDLKAPFASHDQNELGSFFNGPSPAFSSSVELSEELSDFATHLAELDDKVGEWDIFIDSVCSPTEEDGTKVSA